MLSSLETPAIFPASDPAALQVRNTADLSLKAGVSVVDDGVRQPGDLRTGMLSANTQASIRYFKKSFINHKVSNPRTHDFSRFVLPITESEIKEHKRLRSSSVDGLDSPTSSADSFNSAATTLAPGNLSPPSCSDGDEAAAADDRQLSQDEQFLRQLLREFRVVRSFRSNSGVPKSELKGLDGDASEQLESRLSIDDQDTPDSWIPRSPELRRLTGKHPLNAEPDLLRLFEAGMITPTKLHFVRNHGAVPQLHWERHTVLMYADPSELMSKPREWTMDELASGAFDIIEIPVTIGCDGSGSTYLLYACLLVSFLNKHEDRRREVNMVKRTVGFNWTASGVSTALWRGIPVRDVLLACGLREVPDEEIWYLNFEGADEPSMGRYATSIPLAHAMDPTNDVILAFGMNGRVLHPDHGYPLRVVIPGYVGGRQIKWLKRIWITKEPNQSHYHLWDNKVVPSFIDSKSHPLAKVYFGDESTACWEQTMQSIICRPAHEELINIPDEEALQKTYTVQGFAFNGGGNRIERVELTLDGGKTWRWCFRRFLDTPMRHGSKFWAWLFWACEVKIQELVDAFEIIVRAQDNKKMYQSEHITCNSWYRVRPNVRVSPVTGSRIVRFQHPVAPLEEEGGWMKSLDSEDAPHQTYDERIGALPKFSLEEIAKHDKMDDAWIILDSKVYDITSVLSWHPGKTPCLAVREVVIDMILSVHSIRRPAINALYKNIHDSFAHGKRDECLIGILTLEGIEAIVRDAKRAAEELEELKASRQGLALQPDVFIAAKLIRRKDISADSRLYTFELPRNADGSPGTLGLPVGQHMQIAVHFKDRAVLRSYTPVRPVLPEEEDGTFDLLVKTYLPDAEGDVPFLGGTISNYLDCMDEGEVIDIRGPCGTILYRGQGHFEINRVPQHFEKAPTHTLAAWLVVTDNMSVSQVNLIAGGSGVTPHWQLIHAILSDPSDATLVTLVDSNTTVEDVWQREALEMYAAKHATRFKLWHVLSSSPEGWQVSLSFS
ncbi:hypothetical protein BN946_scf184815.g34 [Trametes cinnabarina]|uniref:Nitrate reductase [NADPH] n=1 Tax=Pycnoporus cinnabarinus TaxID=5643 RepID=A0A060S205_PYCCI|nr:hypothetical protein BN946_scf184815.g34 [Trametes cinnabarina]